MASHHGRPLLLALLLLLLLLLCVLVLFPVWGKVKISSRGTKFSTISSVPFLGRERGRGKGGKGGGREGGVREKRG